MPIMSSWLMVVFSSSIYLLIFCLLAPSIMERGLVKSPAIYVELSISLFRSVSLFLQIFWSSVVRGKTFSNGMTYL